MTIALCMAPEIWSITDRIFCYFGPFFALLPPPPPNNPKNKNFKKMKIKNTWRYYHFTHVYHKSQSYNEWFPRYQARQRDFFVILDYFLPFYSLTTQTIKILKKWKIHLEILSFYKCVPSMMYDSWDVECDG